MPFNVYDFKTYTFNFKLFFKISLKHWVWIEKEGKKKTQYLIGQSNI